jgi:hypothetical protein
MSPPPEYVVALAYIIDQFFLLSARCFATESVLFDPTNLWPGYNDRGAVAITIWVVIAG